MAGIDGSTGPTGPTGYNGWSLNEGMPGLPGPTGPQGIQGIAGEAAFQGLKGDTGPRGTTGPTGCTGPTGPTGAVGKSSTAMNVFRYNLILSGSAEPPIGTFRFSDSNMKISEFIYLSSKTFAQDASGNDITDGSGADISVFLDTINEYASSDKYGYIKVQSVYDFNQFMTFKIVKTGVTNPGYDSSNNKYYRIEVLNVSPYSNFQNGPFYLSFS